VSEEPDKFTAVAGNGLLDRRFFLRAGVAGSVALMTASATATERPPTAHMPGAGMGAHGAPSSHEAHIGRGNISAQAGTTGAGASRTPLEHLDGIITPSRLHFERHHSGIPDIDPAQHKLIIHGLVQRPLSFDVESLARYPMVSRIQFLECSGNSGVLTAPEPVQAGCGSIHGLVSASEWGGVPLALLLEEAGIKAEGRWIIADGADAAMMSRSVPLAKVLDDAIVALYQNGERLRPSNGYPMRLFLPGWEGNISVKWLRTIKVTAGPAMTKDETSKYSDLMNDGKARLFTFPMGVKSVITSPSPGLAMREPGIYQISGLAWSGSGRIRRVEVSTDGGVSWAEASLDAQVLPKCLTRFRAAWRWDGGPATIMSRAIDETGNEQPTRSHWLQGQSNGNYYHYNAIHAWRIGEDGEALHVYV
jgi:sulfane dehydrogenase subunit SoxC